MLFGANRISVAAKTHYIVSNRGASSLDEINSASSQLGWKVSPADIQGSVAFLSDLGLVRTS